MMRLLLDVGNTRIKWGVRSEGQWLAKGAIATMQWARLGGLLQQYPQVNQGLAAQVAGETVASGIAALCEEQGIQLTRLEPGMNACGVTNAYAIPKQLGADRWASLIGARKLTPSPLVVVNAGTATTIDALASDGAFLGGLILPGISLMAQALAKGTADLPATVGDYAVFPCNTADAMTTGSILATVGAIERLAQFLQAREKLPVGCLLTGGAQHWVAGHIRLPVKSVEDLVLEGLACLAGC